MNEKVSWESQPLPHLNQFSQKLFLRLLKERGERGVWFKKWFTQESIGDVRYRRIRITSKVVVV
jgi:hypothetical protein